MNQTTCTTWIETRTDDNLRDQNRWRCENHPRNRGAWFYSEERAEEGARDHRQQHNGGPKALQDLLTLEW